jgi:sugar/nucleoside kinase (ribokinase family)
LEKKIDIITIGESLVEFSTDMKLEDAECLHKYYGGDTLAAAVSALRLGSEVGFITCVGEDCFKNYLINNWKSEGLDISQVKFSPDRNGIYFIARPSIAQKEIVHYRKKIAPAKLTIEDIAPDYIANSKAVYSSGITQSLSLSVKEAVAYAFKAAKELGIITAYDPNFHPHITTPEEARENFNEVISDIDILFLSAKYDTVNILELTSVENIIKKLWDAGVGTVVLKSGADKGYYTGSGGNIVFTKFYTQNVVDTTCSGDTFNGAFLHAVLHGCSPFEAAKLASVAAGLQAEKIGAIKPIPYKDEVYSLYGEG